MQLRLPSGRLVPAQDVADALGLPGPDLVEKDYHVMRALQAIATVGHEAFQLVFAGGTSLARAHKVLRRMSEDIDLKILPRVEFPSGSSQRTALRALREQIIQALTDAGFIPNRKQIRVRNEGAYCQIPLDYPRTEIAYSILRPRIQIELTLAQLRTNIIELPISSFVSEALKSGPDIAAFPCFSIPETAAEKLVSLTRRIACDLENPGRIEFDPALVRHIYDLHATRGHVNVDAVAALAGMVAAHDAEVFAGQFPQYTAAPQAWTEKAVVALESEAKFQEQYDAFLRRMVYGDHYPFETAIVRVRDLTSRMWSPPAR